MYIYDQIKLSENSKQKKFLYIFLFYVIIIIIIKQTKFVRGKMMSNMSSKNLLPLPELEYGDQRAFKQVSATDRISI